MEKVKHIENIKEAISKANQTVLFGKSDEDPLITACADYLIFKGYKLTKSVIGEHSVLTSDELICFFYNMLSLKHPNYVSGYRNIIENRMIAKRFIEARMVASDINKKEALTECVEIIRTVFKYENEFNFKYELSFRLFGQDRLGWVTDKAIQIMNRELKYKREADADKRMEEMIEAQGTEDLGFDNLQDILDMLEKNNGK